MFIKIKNMPKLGLANLLRRRKMTLKQFIEEFGISTYAGLETRCARMGVEPPTEDEYKVVRPNMVSSPSDGVVVLPPLVDEEFDLDDVSEESKKKRKKRKQESS
jgi:hypothetical protein